MTDQVTPEQVEQQVDESKRGTGRTTRAVLRALLEAAGGRRVAFIARTTLHADAARVSACVAAKSLGIGCQLRKGQVLDFSFGGGSIVFIVESSAAAETAAHVTIRDLDEDQGEARVATASQVKTEQVREDSANLRGAGSSFLMADTTKPLGEGLHNIASRYERLAAERDEQAEWLKQARELICQAWAAIEGEEPSWSDARELDLVDEIESIVRCRNCARAEREAAIARAEKAEAELRELRLGYCNVNNSLEVAEADNARLAAIVEMGQGKYADDSQPVNGWFGLSYNAYLVVPRSLLQSMPRDWQARLCAMLDEMVDTPAGQVFLKHHYRVERTCAERDAEIHDADVHNQMHDTDEHVEVPAVVVLDDPLANYRYPSKAIPWRAEAAAKGEA